MVCGDCGDSGDSRADVIDDRDAIDVGIRFLTHPRCAISTAEKLHNVIAPIVTRLIDSRMRPCRIKMAVHTKRMPVTMM